MIGVTIRFYNEQYTIPICNNTQHKTKRSHTRQIILVLHSSQLRVDGVAEPSILRIMITYSPKRRR